MAKPESAAREALEADRDLVARHVQAAGGSRTLVTALRAAEADLADRLAALKPGMRGSFSEAQMKATMRQIRESARVAEGGIKAATLERGVLLATRRVSGTLKYLELADEAYRGVGSTPLALDHARLMDRAVEGAGASILGRLGESGEGARGANVDEHRAKGGILDRYGRGVVKSFEGEMTKGILARKSFDEIADDITGTSPFLKKAPRFWAERIVRTETMAASNKAALEGIRGADEDEGGDAYVKILSATFDDRTGWDSFMVHGQIRLPDEAFEWATARGEVEEYMAPPNRPNDREVVVPHALRWAIPDSLRWLPPGDYRRKFREQVSKKRSPPSRPKMTTVPLSRFPAK